ncbi:hypothetical protein DL93DRAFT_2079617 [Clavulina sp. PMI_390]|nr:hypothetical protein DL93DRAFT_2079617 [Clavulina sp. PMI_390]
MGDRAELIRNALAFLQDPSTRDHPLTQRIAFLESKGLTNAEIESVLSQAQAAPPSAPSSRSAFAPVQPYVSPYASIQQPPAVPQRDWRDYFIMAVVSGGFMFGVVSFARKYLLPHLQPPSATAYEADHDALTAQFDEVAKLISSIETETAAQRTALDDQKDKVDSAIDKLQLAINETREAENKTKAELREIRDEVNNVRDMLPKMLEKNKDAQSQALLDLQQELKSLKTLLLTRSGPSMPSTLPYSSSTSPSSFASLAGTAPPLPRPSIPSWQLPVTPAPAAVPAPAPVVAPVASVEPPKVDKGKGKATEPEAVEPLAASGVLVPEVGSESEAEDAASSIIA